jgi:hypothetical protein
MARTLRTVKVWKILGLAGLAGVAATGFVVVRRLAEAEARTA